MKETKRCPTCNLVKPSRDFSMGRTRSDGLASHCKPCAANKCREYFKTAKYKAYMREYSKKRYEKNKLRCLAMAKVRQAVLKGTLIKPDECGNCWNRRPLEGHHADYSKPLDVSWLCRPCHMLKHGTLRNMSLISAEKVQ